MQIANDVQSVTANGLGGFALPTFAELVGPDLVSSPSTVLTLGLQLIDKASHAQTEVSDSNLFEEWQSCCTAKGAVQHQACGLISEPFLALHRASQKRRAIMLRTIATSFAQ